MKRRKTRNNRRRKGIATTEMAFCMPVVILLMLAIVETCTVIFLKETVTIAAYEGVRAGIQKQGTDSDATTAVTNFLDQRGIVYESNYMTISDPGFDDASDLEHVTVSVFVPCEGNTYTGWIFSGRSVSATVTMRKEYANTE